MSKALSEIGRICVLYLQFARDIKLKQQMGEKADEGRPKGSWTKQEIIQECKEKTGLTYPTVRKWWDKS